MGNTNKREVVISLSLGLMLLVVVHAITLATAQRIAPYVEEAVYSVPTGGINFDAVHGSSPGNSRPVNAAARDEVKGAPQSCTTCPKAPQVVLAPPQRVQPKAPPIKPKATSKPVTPRYSISVFVLHADPASQQLLNWLNSDASLQQWKKSTNYQAYTKDNQLYKSRYAKVIPESAFPAVLVTDPNGGHVYVCDRYSLPSDAQSLVNEIGEAVKLQKQIVPQAAAQTAISESTPIKLVSATAARPPCVDGTCVDGTCVPSETPARGPLDGFLGIRPSIDPTSRFIRSMIPNAEFMTAVVIVIGVVFVVYFIKQRVQ